MSNASAASPVSVKVLVIDDSATLLGRLSRRPQVRALDPKNILNPKKMVG